MSAFCTEADYENSINAILDRILHNSHVITITGNSYRLKDCVSRIIVHFYLTFYERYHWWSKN